MLEEVLQYGGLYCTLTSREASTILSAVASAPQIRLSLRSTVGVLMLSLLFLFPSRAPLAQDPLDQRTLGPRLWNCGYACAGCSMSKMILVHKSFGMARAVGIAEVLPKPRKSFLSACSKFSIDPQDTDRACSGCGSQA